MPTSSILTDQLATLGVPLPTWPVEPEDAGATGDWIQRGQAYAEGLRLWRAQLRNAPESTKAVMSQLLRHLHDTDQVGGWDQLVCAAIKPEVQGLLEVECWQECAKLICSSTLTPAQSLGMALELAREQLLAAATYGLKRLLKELPELGLQERLVLCAELLAVANTSQLMKDAHSGAADWKHAVEVHEQMAGLLAEATSFESVIGSSQWDNQGDGSALFGRIEALHNYLCSKEGHRESAVIQRLEKDWTDTHLRAHVRTGPPVTLTAISSRMSTLPVVLKSLQQQTYLPAQVHLHLSHEPHLLDQGVAEDDPLLRDITANGWVQVHWVPNMGPYRKIIPFLQAGGYGRAVASQSSDDLFITVDDDTLYPPRFIEYMVRNYERHCCVVAHRGRRIRLQEGEPSGAFLPYAQWHDGVREPRLANLPTGQSGVLYRRSWFPQDLELEAALALAPTHDDLWLRWLTARNGVQAVILQPNAAAKTKDLAFPSASPELIAQEKTLWHAYNGPAGGNDDAVVAVQAYWQARGFDLAALLAEEQEREADFY